MIERIRDPVVRNAVAVKDLKLVDAIVLRIGRRYELADPVGADRDRTSRGRLGDTVAAPSCEIVDKDLVRFVRDFGAEPPPAGPASTGRPLEPSAEDRAESDLRAAVLERRRRSLHDRAVDHLGADIVRQRREIGERGFRT